MSKVCMFMADGFEEIEALAVVDLLRRGGAEVTMMSIGSSVHVRGRSGIEITADTLWRDEAAEAADMLILPGGQPGTRNLGSDEKVAAQLKKAAHEGRVLAAICAAPTVFADQGCLNGRRATCYPGLENVLLSGGAEVVTNEEVVVDGNVITSRGAGTAIPFGIKLIEVLSGAEAAKAVSDGIVFNVTM